MKWSYRFIFAFAFEPPYQTRIIRKFNLINFSFCQPKRGLEKSYTYVIYFDYSRKNSSKVLLEMTVAIWRGFFSTNIRSEFQFLKILVHEEVKAYYKKTQFNNACINFLNRNITRDDVAIFGPDGNILIRILFNCIYWFTVDLFYTVKPVRLYTCVHYKPAYILRL